MFVCIYKVIYDRSVDLVTFFFFFLIAYFTPDVIGESLTNSEIPYIKVFGICPSPSGGGGDLTYDLRVTRQDHYHVATR